MKRGYLFLRQEQHLAWCEEGVFISEAGWCEEGVFISEAGTTSGHPPTSLEKKLYGSLGGSSGNGCIRPRDWLWTSEPGRTKKTTTTTKKKKKISETKIPDTPLHNVHRIEECALGFAWVGLGGSLNPERGGGTGGPVTAPSGIKGHS